MNKEPYIFRKTGGNGNQETDMLVGGSIVWNQLASLQSSDWTKARLDFSSNNNVITLTPTQDNSLKYASISVSAGHKYLITGTYLGSLSNFIWQYGIYYDIGHGRYSSRIFIGYDGEDHDFASVLAVRDSDTSAIFLLGMGTTSTTSNYVSAENVQIHDLTRMFGSTIADYIYDLETANEGDGVAYFRKLFSKPYYAYNTGELMHVTGVSAHTMRDADENVIGTYELDDSLTLRGIPKIADGKLYYDGDAYESDGTVTRNYGIRAYASGDEEIENAITDGTNTVYKLDTPTTESADPFTNPQLCDPLGTEEYVTTGIVPVGHETEYSESPIEPPLEPMTRVEQFLDDIAKEKTPSLEPLMRIEVFLDAIARNETPSLSPLTRIETFLDAIARNTTPSLTPLTRVETWLDAIARNTTCDLTPLTRLEWFLSQI